MEQHTVSTTDADREQLVRQIIDLGVVAVIRMTDTRKLVRVAEAIHRGGVSALEVTMTVPNALEMIAQVAREMGDQIVLGVGSVLNAETARQAIEAGARYVVSPIFKPEIIAEAHRLGCPAMPGVFTPTEAQAAYEAGADICKVFPAEVTGMAFIKAVKAPLPHLRLMPTGGVTPANAGEWIRAGACAVGVGSALLDKKAIDEENFAALEENARRLVRSVREGRGA